MISPEKKKQATLKTNHMTDFLDFSRAPGSLRVLASSSFDIFL